jgi:hypothetical protein
LQNESLVGPSCLQEAQEAQQGQQEQEKQRRLVGEGVVEEGARSPEEEEEEEEEAVGEQLLRAEEEAVGEGEHHCLEEEGAEGRSLQLVVQPMLQPMECMALEEHLKS